MKLELVLLAAVGGCSSFSTEDAASDAGTAQADVGAPGAATFCQAMRAQAGGAFAACEDFEGPPGAGGFQRGQDGLTIDMVDSEPGNPTHSGRVSIGPSAGARKAALLITAGSYLHYHLEGRVKIEGSVGEGGIAPVMVKLLSQQNHEGSAYIVRSGQGTIHQLCASSHYGGAVICAPSPIPETFPDWTRIAVDFDASTGDVVVTIGTAQYPHKMTPFGSVASADIELGAVGVPAGSEGIVHLDDVFAARQ